MKETHSQTRRSSIFEEWLKMTRITGMFDLTLIKFMVLGNLRTKMVVAT